MEPAVAEPVTIARKRSVEAAAARQRAVAALSTAEDNALADAIHERMSALATLLGDAVARDDAIIKRRRTFRPEWVCPPDLLLKLQLRNAARPDLVPRTWRVHAVNA